MAARKTPRGPRLPRTWVDPVDPYADCAVTSQEFDEAAAAARRDLLRGKKPVPAGTTPHMIITIGSPGAGKSTVAEAVAKKRGGENYVTIDTDTAIKYHPRYRGLWKTQSPVTSRMESVGFPMKYMQCDYALGEILYKILAEVTAADGPRFNVIFQVHDHENIIIAKHDGYRVTLLFVGAPLETALARTRARAVETGMFLAPTLTAQDEIVRSMWGTYRTTAAWYGLWADEFLVADNGRKNAPPRVVAVPLRGADRDKSLRAAQAAIDAACGV